MWYQYVEQRPSTGSGAGKGQVLLPETLSGSDRDPKPFCFLGLHSLHRFFPKEVTMLFPLTCPQGCKKSCGLGLYRVLVFLFTQALPPLGCLSAGHQCASNCLSAYLPPSLYLLQIMNLQGQRPRHDITGFLEDPLMRWLGTADLMK